MVDADPAELGERDRHVRLGHRVHRRGQDRDVQRDVAGEECPGVRLAWQDPGFERLQKDVVEGESEGNVGECRKLGHIGP